MAWSRAVMLLLSIPCVSCSRVRVVNTLDGSEHLYIRPPEMLATDLASVCPRGFSPRLYWLGCAWVCYASEGSVVTSLPPFVDHKTVRKGIAAALASRRTVGRLMPVQVKEK